MTYRELLEKYKVGTLTEDEKILVEQELEKSEAINDYLAEEIEKSLLAKNEGTTDTRNEKIKIEKSIKRMVYKRLAAVVVISVVCVFVINLIIQYIISPLVSSQYYDPTRKTSGQKYQQDFAYDIQAVTEVSEPEYVIRGYPYAEKLGFGKYNIYYERENLFTKEKETVGAQINKSKRVGGLDNFYTNQESYLFTKLWNGQEGSSGYEMSLEMNKRKTETQIAHIRDLPSTSYISAWVRFSDDLTMEELCKYEYFTFKDIDFKWIAVRTAENHQLMGFYSSSTDILAIGDRIDQDRYPGFQLQYLMSTPYDTSFVDFMAKSYETHYTSLLKYLVDHQDAVATLVGSTNSFSYKSALEYAENSGVRAYGALVFGEADELLKLYDSGNILTLTIDNVIASQYIQ